MWSWLRKILKCKCLSVSLLGEGSWRASLALIPFCDPMAYQGPGTQEVLGDSLLKEFQIWIVP